MGRLGERFAALRARGERALVPFVTAGDPDLAINTIMRHSHFTINQHVVDDLVECINTGSRAALRAGLERVQGGPSMEIAGCADVFRFHR